MTKRKLKYDSRQSEIDFNRGEQRRLLNNAKCVRREVKGTGVSPAAQKAVLNAIDAKAVYKIGQISECWAAIETIASVAGLSERQTKRAIKALLSASLITCERKWNHTSQSIRNHYRIVWSELALILRPKCRDDTLQSGDQSAVTSDQSAVTSDQSAVTSRPKCRDDTQTIHDNHKNISLRNHDHERANRVIAEKDFSSEAIDQIIEMVAQVPFDLSKQKKDWEFANKAAALCWLGVWPEAWWYSSLESVRSKSVEIRYWIGIFRRKIEIERDLEWKEGTPILRDSLNRVWLPLELQWETVNYR